MTPRAATALAAFVGRPPTPTTVTTPAYLIWRLFTRPSYGERCTAYICEECDHHWTVDPTGWRAARPLRAQKAGLVPPASGLRSLRQGAKIERGAAPRPRLVPSRRAGRDDPGATVLAGLSPSGRCTLAEKPAPEAALPPWHSLEAPEVAERLGTGRDGLSSAESAARLERDGPNELAAEHPPGWWVVLARQFAGPLIFILLVATIITLALREHI
ncbi:MAG: hypothetical protein FJW79_06360, partial [Actinobacteria bacterium]|nr:hypothetical protein [Actinomycetota bacterium]